MFTWRWVSSAVLSASIVLGGAAWLSLRSGPARSESATPQQLTIYEAQSTASAEQQAALNDGVVTWEEHEAAIAKTATCMAENGLTVETMPAVGHAPTRLGFKVDSVARATEAETVLAACRTRFLASIDDVYSAQQSAPDNMARGDVFLKSCLIRKGVAAGSLPEGPNLAGILLGSDVASIRDATTSCVHERRVEMGF